MHVDNMCSLLMANISECLHDNVWSRLSHISTKLEMLACKEEVNSVEILACALTHKIQYIWYEFGTLPLDKVC